MIDIVHKYEITLLKFEVVQTIKYAGRGHTNEAKDVADWWYEDNEHVDQEDETKCNDYVSGPVEWLFREKDLEHGSADLTEGEKSKGQQDSGRMWRAEVFTEPTPINLTKTASCLSCSRVVFKDQSAVVDPELLKNSSKLLSQFYHRGYDYSVLNRGGGSVFQYYSVYVSSQNSSAGILCCLSIAKYLLCLGWDKKRSMLESFCN